MSRLRPIMAATMTSASTLIDPIFPRPARLWEKTGPYSNLAAPSQTWAAPYCHTLSPRPCYAWECLQIGSHFALAKLSPRGGEERRRDQRQEWRPGPLPRDEARID